MYLRPGLDGFLHRLFQRQLGADVDQLDEAGQIGARQHFDLAALEQRQRQVAGRAAEHVGGDDHAATEIDRFRGRRDFALAALDIVFRPDADGAQMGLRPHHMLHRRNEFLRQAAMGDEDDADHE